MSLFVCRFLVIGLGNLELELLLVVGLAVDFALDGDVRAGGLDLVADAAAEAALVELLVVDLHLLGQVDRLGAHGALGRVDDKLGRSLALG